MKNTGLNQIREAFLNFYTEKDHYRRKSFSLIPEKDKSLLLINSGMAPLKPYFSGQETPPANRMVTCQKCIRTGDIDNVGITSRHGTFFEMLGSFSFGDYFKEESLVWGWEFLTDVLELPQEQLWVSVYQEDDEAYDIWKNKIKFPEERIVRLGKEDNFWEIGTGPCGPCSEIYYDRGEAFGCDRPDCKPGCDCDRYIEFWNHVFTQFSRHPEGHYTDLAHPNIDTGMGLERVACILQEVDSIFDIDTIRYILDAVVEKAGIAYKNGTLPTDLSIKIITDHIRSVVFMIGDNIIPSNEGRRYVLRRLLRRAARHGKLLGIEGNFLADLSGKVIDISGTAYPELEEKRAFIYKIITNEESRFNATLDQGTDILNQYIEEMKRNGDSILKGKKVFKLYDTYGFPLELTQEILGEKGCFADVDGFNTCMEKQRSQGKADHDAQEDEGWKKDSVQFVFEGASRFTGYEKVTDTGIIKALFWDQRPLTSIREGETGRIILDQTPFYAEGGGQAGDIGGIYNDDFIARVLETRKFKDVTAHKVFVEKGEVFPNDEVYTIVDVPNRNQTARNHTATHLLHKALKEVLGEHVQQEGSNVTAQGLRFDFNHFDAVTEEELQTIEKIVNDKINHFLPVIAEELPIKEAMNSGAIGIFDEKYGEVVRVISVGTYSKELCGGIHVENSGQIGAFKITGESSVAAGVRRIEAFTGTKILEALKTQDSIVQAVSQTLKTKPDLLEEKARSIVEETKMLKKELADFKKLSMANAADKMLSDAKEINGVRLLTRTFKDGSVNELRALSDDIKAQNKNVVLVLAMESGEKVSLLVSVTDDLIDKGFHAGNMMKEIAKAAGGSGGGKANMAQAGAKDLARIPAAFAKAEEILRNC